MFWKSIKFAPLPLLVVLFAGCWGAKFIEMPQRSIDTSAAVDSLLVREARLRRRIYNLEKQLAEQQEYSRRTTAKNKLDIEELKDQLNAVRQLLSESSVVSKRSGVKSSGRPGRSFGTSERGEVEDSGATSDSLPSIRGRSEVLSDSSGTREGHADTVLSRSGFPSAEQMHRQIYLDFSRMEYQIALDEAEEFLSEYPDHYLAEDVIFIRGECLMEQEKYFDALMEFSKMLKNSPKGDKVPGALLRMGIAYQKIGDRDLSAGVLRRLAREYPESEEAATARDRYGDLLKD